jgi:hypothetical protein
VNDELDERLSEATGRQDELREEVDHLQDALVVTAHRVQALGVRHLGVEVEPRPVRKRRAT